MGFRMTVRTTGANETFTFPMNPNGGTVNCEIAWGDGNTDTITAYNDPLLAHQYANAGDHDIEITSGTWTAPYFNDGGDNFKVIEVKEWGSEYGTDWSGAFYGCNNLAVVSATDITGVPVQIISEMFRGCTSLTTLDVSDWYVGAVTNMDAAFRDCSSLTLLDVVTWDVSSVENMSALFRDCSSLMALDIANWDTSSVTTMSFMFRDCSSLTMLDVSNWNTSSVGNMSYMFRNCDLLATLDVSNWDTSSVGNMSYMFQACSSLTLLDVSNWNVSSVSNMTNMLYGCDSLTEFDVSNWDVSSLGNTEQMFRNCDLLTTIDVSAWNVSSVTRMSNMFLGSGFSDQSYDALLDGWSKLTLQNSVTFHAGTAKYALANERAVLTDTFGWSVTDGGPQELDYLVDGFLWYAINDNVYFSDGTNTLNLLDLDPQKIGIAYGDGQMRLTVDGVDSAEVDYDGDLLIGLLDIFRGATAKRKMRNLQRYDGTYAEAKTKIDQLMA